MKKLLSQWNSLKGHDKANIALGSLLAVIIVMLLLL